MPAARNARRSGKDIDSLNWAPVPPEPEAQGGISFSTNLTPDAFVDPATERKEMRKRAKLAAATSAASPYPNPSSQSSKVSHSKKQPDDHVKRPPNAFILFRRAFIAGGRIGKDAEHHHSHLSKVAGHVWKSLPEDERMDWKAKADQVMIEHHVLYPNYKYTPSNKKSGAAPKPKKRKMKDVPKSDGAREEYMAKMLIDGVTEDALTAAMETFDKQHGRGFQAVFAAPITETAFRRASSAPIPEDSTPFLEKKSSLKAVKPRANSEQPARTESLSIATTHLSTPAPDFSSYEFGKCETSSPTETSYFGAPSPLDTSASPLSSTAASSPTATIAGLPLTPTNFESQHEYPSQLSTLSLNAYSTEASFDGQYSPVSPGPLSASPSFTETQWSGVSTMPNSPIPQHMVAHLSPPQPLSACSSYEPFTSMPEQLDQQHYGYTMQPQQQLQHQHVYQYPQEMAVPQPTVAVQDAYYQQMSTPPMSNIGYVDYQQPQYCQQQVYYDQVPTMAMENQMGYANGYFDNAVPVYAA